MTKEIARVLAAYGSVFCGDDPEFCASAWTDCGFTASEVDAWCQAGIWDADVACKLRAAGLSPADVLQGAAKLIDRYGRDMFTDGSPTYAVCNSDLDVDTLIAAAREAKQ